MTSLTENHFSDFERVFGVFEIPENAIFREQAEYSCLSWEPIRVWELVENGSKEDFI